MTNKNTFEIRSEVLQLAKEYMDEQHHLNLRYCEKMIEQGKIRNEEWLNSFKPYTFEEMMEKAKEMYDFVSNKE